MLIGGLVAARVAHAGHIGPPELRRTWSWAGWSGTLALMGSYIEAIVFSNTGPAAPVPDGFTIVPLSAGLSMLPITEDLARRLDPSAIGDDRIPADWMLRQPVAALARSLSADRAVVYIHSETFAGPGTREAIAFRFGKLLYGRAGTSDIEHDLEPGYHLAWAITTR